MHQDTGFCNLAVRGASRAAYDDLNYMVYKGKSSKFNLDTSFRFIQFFKLLFACHILIALNLKVNVLLIFKLNKPD